MQLEAIEPSHGTLALGRPALHRLVHVHPFNVTRHQRCGVYDGNARALAQGVAALCKAIGLSCRLYYLAICGTQKEPSLLCLLFVS